MSADRKKAGVGFWIACAMIAVVVAYPLSFGPACWGYNRFGDSEAWEMMEKFYGPILWTWYEAPNPISNVIDWYANLGAAYNVGAAKMLDGSYCVVMDWTPSR